MSCYIPQGYKSLLSVYDTQKAIGLSKRIFEDNLCGAMHLFRVSAPLLVDGDSGINDNLNGVERPVQFDIPAVGKDAQIVQSLAKWKRLALYRYGFRPGQGLVTDMNAIRRDEELDNLHSIYVDQWDWEKVLLPEDRSVEMLKSTVQSIVTAICDTQRTMKSLYPELSAVTDLRREVAFITSEELLALYPNNTSKERENLYLKEHGTAFIIGIGGVLSNGMRHDGRSPDYDDWTLNGDLLFWNDDLNCAIELSSMGIRVSPESLAAQLDIAGCNDRRDLYFHKLLLDGKLPYTIGGGIGQSRFSMLILGKVHIGEVQVSCWDEDTIDTCQNAGVLLL